jgi:hypothetical protein
MAKKPTSDTDAESSSALPKKTVPTEGKGTARDVYMKAILSDPQFRELPQSGKTFTILGARPQPPKGTT